VSRVSGLAATSPAPFGWVMDTGTGMGALKTVWRAERAGVRAFAVASTGAKRTIEVW
jgi:hypothetical protein